MLVPASISIPIGIAILKYKVLVGPYKVLGWYLLLAAFTSILFNVMAARFINNLPLSHLYTVVELSLISIFYKRVFSSTRFNKWCTVTIVCFLLLALANAIFVQGIYTFNTYTKSLESLVVMVLAIAYFLKSIDVRDVRADNGSLNLINSGFLLYFSGSFIWFSIFNFTVSNMSLGLIMWSIHATLLLIEYLMIAKALWKLKP